ncbi:hypothetical protein P4S93_03795 [Aneurinibacillus thermoaerophilus]|uniref:Uncharacterized protein n=1 Tax=Aneurinibacillus thermoaerophilus TaxID=143495 RepID=A0A1G7WZ81_ANETH|nr:MULTISPECIES: hypothetical protein [Aneurinibacillus]AMA73868.1 hypothetical protein ACH33_14140 [Aneurinibacillus sp. XH2]MED0755766.1 hypothetical protein [Aneurinibacillus thermoaerophilus]MED0759905.1 hypothetical protein [Aneurinibacillus thermoaerophilus]QYY43558.1 hypothetical protein K3F53_04770 [Aneurinibacillus thermoaerophilus]SDG77228.1 hypothetical protein SAMN04489735_1002242 [Aneurinibacillus thermoaerophilus]
MPSERESSVLVDFFAERKAKQRAFNEMHERLMEKMHEYACRTLNLREKVRAKHVFRSKLTLPSEALLIPFWEAQYGIWLLLEYQNIKGERIIEKYLMEENADLSEQELHLAARWMAAYPSIYRVIEAWEEGYRVDDIWAEETMDVALGEREQVRSEFMVGQYLFARLAKVGFIHRFIGPYALIPKERIPLIKQSLEADFERSKKENNSQWSWRLFMQQHGIKALRIYQ